VQFAKRQAASAYSSDVLSQMHSMSVAAHPLGSSSMKRHRSCVMSVKGSTPADENMGTYTACWNVSDCQFPIVEV